LDKIHWPYLLENPGAISILEQNQDKIDRFWDCLSKNPKAISLLEQNQDKIDWFWFLRNPSIFEPDYQEMSKERMKIIYQELMEKALHPSRVLKWINEEEEEEDYDF
jgi:hypothetical protein